MAPPFSNFDYSPKYRIEGGGGGGGALAPNSVNSSHIINESITAADLYATIEGLDTFGVVNLNAALATITSELAVQGPTTLDTLSAGATTIDSLVVNSTVFVDSLTAYEATINSSLSVLNEVQAKLLVYETRSGQKAYGTATLVGGTVTVTNAIANLNDSLIFLSRNNVVSANHMGHLYVVKGNGSFQIVSTNHQDNNVVDYIIIYGS
jgi:hypothetical protein